jgi:hypothetical protein
LIYSREPERTRVQPGGASAPLRGDDLA